MITSKFNQLGIDIIHSSSEEDISANVSFYVSDFQNPTAYMEPNLLLLKYFDETQFHDIPFTYNFSTKQTTISVSTSKLFTLTISAEGYLSAANNYYYDTLKNHSLLKIDETSEDDPSADVNPFENIGTNECAWTQNKDIDSHILCYARNKVSAETELSSCTPDYHVYYNQKTYTSNGKTIAKLDADITSIPSGSNSAKETLRIFELSAYDFVISYVMYTSNTSLSGSGLAVNLNLEGMPYGPYKITDAIPVDSNGIWWHLAEVRNKELKLINVLTNSTVYKGLKK